MRRQARAIWVKVLNETPISVRRRASPYLKRVKKTSENSWLVWSREGVQYVVRLEGDHPKCSCPFDEKEPSPCKHICAVAVNELMRMEVKPWLEELKKKL